MSAVPKRKLSVAEYLAIENAAEHKSEFFAGEMFAMAGASPEHNAITENLSVEIGSRLKGSGCRTYSSDLRVLIDRTGLFCYPDVVVVCGEPQFAGVDPQALLNPVVVIEVLSDSTWRYDRTTKFRNYQQIPSLREYILVAQDEPLAERYVRQADGAWAMVSFVGLDATLQLASTSVAVQLRDIYADVSFKPAAK